jgi:hypothetical protein
VGKKNVFYKNDQKMEEDAMKFKHLFFVLVLLMVGLITLSCVTSGGDGGDGNVTDPPNFTSDTCGGCPVQENIGSVTGIRFFSYVKNIGGGGKISMTIGSGTNTATQQFDVTAGTSYTFQASVPVEASATSSFTYLALFPGLTGYIDSRAINGYHVTGAPFNLQMNPR